MCIAQRQHTIARAFEEFYCLRGETRTSRIPFTLGNPCGYQLPEIPHTYPPLKLVCATARYISEVVLHSSCTLRRIFPTNSKHSASNAALASFNPLTECDGEIGVQIIYSLEIFLRNLRLLWSSRPLNPNTPGFPNLKKQ